MTRWSVRYDAEARLLVPRCVAKLRSLIADGVLKPGDRLPTEPVLASRMDVSRTTLRAAVAELVSESVLERRRGVGTFVAGALPSLQHGLERLFGGTESIAQLGMKPGTADLELDHIPLPPEIADALGGTDLEPAVRLRRTRTADGIPVLWTEEWIPERVLDPPDALDDFSTADSLTARLAQVGINIRLAKAILRPVLPAPHIQQSLKLRPGDPVIEIEQLVYAGPLSRGPVLLSHNVYNSERVQLHAIRRA